MKPKNEQKTLEIFKILLEENNQQRTFATKIIKDNKLERAGKKTIKKICR